VILPARHVLGYLMISELMPDSYELPRALSLGRIKDEGEEPCGIQVFSNGKNYYTAMLRTMGGPAADMYWKNYDESVTKTDLEFVMYCAEEYVKEYFRELKKSNKITSTQYKNFMELLPYFVQLVALEAYQKGDKIVTDCITKKLAQKLIDGLWEKSYDDEVIYFRNQNSTDSSVTTEQGKLLQETMNKYENVDKKHLTTSQELEKYFDAFLKKGEEIENKSEEIEQYLKDKKRYNALKEWIKGLNLYVDFNMYYADAIYMEPKVRTTPSPIATLLPQATMSPAASPSPEKIVEPTPTVKSTVTP